MVEPFASCGEKKMPSSRTARTEPTLHSAIRPKESDWEFLSLRREVRPIPIAMMNGTVIGPVVTPPESKDTGMKTFGTSAASRKVTT